MSDIISWIFKCPKCGTEKCIASISNSTYYSTWITWQKKGNKWIIGCYGYDINDVWWWCVFDYQHCEKGDKRCWEKFGGATEEEWTKGHFKWKCQCCEHHSKTFTEFIENLKDLNDDNNDEEYED